MKQFHVNDYQIYRFIELWGAFLRSSDNLLSLTLATQPTISTRVSLYAPKNIPEKVPKNIKDPNYKDELHYENCRDNY